jgi:uncharacterized C2H2 Zn-finger protein
MFEGAAELSSCVSSINPFVEFFLPHFTHTVFLIVLFAELQRPYKCPSCGKRYRYKKSLNKHVKWICGKEPQFRCNWCPRAFKQKYDYKTHMKMVHKVIGAQLE